MLNVESRRDGASPLYSRFKIQNSTFLMPKPWDVLARRTVYDSDWIRIHHLDIALPDGSVARSWHLIDYPFAASGIVPIGDDGRILMFRQYRFTTGQASWETPGGRLDQGETALAAAHRELREETGYAARQMDFVGKFFPSCGSSNQVFNVFAARGLSRVSEKTDPNEAMEFRWFTREEIRGMIGRNEIVEGMTLTALLWVFFAENTDGKIEPGGFPR
jgi:ADP-ribose pyrophosphatase